MIADFEIEDVLRRFRAEPSARVKRSVLARFGSVRDTGTTRRGPSSFWKKPVPVYLAAAALLIVGGLSFAAGRSTSRTVDPTKPPVRSAEEKNFATSPELEWVAAENDVL